MDFKDLGWFNEDIAGSTGKSKKKTRRGNMALVADDGGTYTITVRFLEELRATQKMDERSKILIMRECGMSETQAKEFIWSDRARGTPIFLLLGKDAVEIHGVEKDPKSLGLRRFQLSPGLRILECPWSADKGRKFLVSGVVGVDPVRAADGGNQEKYPTFKIDETWEDFPSFYNPPPTHTHHTGF